MKNIFKKVMASVMAVASLAVGMTCVSANATDYTSSAKSSVITIPLNQDSDAYSVFNWGRQGSTVAARLTAKSGTRYGQVAVYGYDSTGGYVGHISNGKILYATSPNIDDRRVEVQGTLSAYSYTFYGTLYLTSQPVGTPISIWVK